MIRIAIGNDESPVLVVTAALTVAILLAASFLIATGTRAKTHSIRLSTIPPAESCRHLRLRSDDVAAAPAGARSGFFSIDAI